jgi:hypothetical protein
MRSNRERGLPAGRDGLSDCRFAERMCAGAKKQSILWISTYIRSTALLLKSNRIRMVPAGMTPPVIDLQPMTNLRSSDVRLHSHALAWGEDGLRAGDRGLAPARQATAPRFSGNALTRRLGNTDSRAAFSLRSAAGSPRQGTPLRAALREVVDIHHSGRGFVLVTIRTEKLRAVKDGSAFVCTASRADVAVGDESHLR